MIRHIDDHSILIDETLGDGIHDRVVETHGVIIVGEDIALLDGKFRTIGILRREETTGWLWITGSVFHM